MTTFKNLAAIAVLSLAFALTSFGQTAPINTPLASQVLATDQNVNLTSVTGVTAIGGLAGQYNTFLFVEGELMGVTTVPSSGTYVGVQRGLMGTRVQQHASGVTVLVGPAGTFITQAPSGYCSPSNYPTSPVVAVGTGKQYTCNATTNQWGETWRIFISGVSCGSKATTTTTTDNGMVPVATNNAVHQFTTNTTAGSTEITCDLNLGGRADIGSGAVVTAVDFLYGDQTTALASLVTATVKTVTYPASTTAGVAAAGTVAAAGGTYVVTPGTLQLTTTTTGQCFNEKLVFGTPIALNTDNQKLTFDQAFTNTASTATVFQICGLLVYGYTPVPALISLD